MTARWPKIMDLVEQLKGWGLEPLRFAISGVANTSAGLSVIYGTKYFLEFNDITANATGYAVGLIVSFTLNSVWTFKYSGSWWPAVIKFLAAFGISYAANLLCVLLLIDALETNSYVAQTIGLIPYTICFYLLSKLVVFRRTRLG